ncbi:hypothetical protein SAMN04488134_109154 [Amphibacillus marinus]|uniref:Rhodanese domain-containing protein n=1 Tax=Amphibacillus marinus TaxID=872970 RepID=A0A1H8R573_9BACI|nr:hypothetical protein [Amphibacillus marinus]SEO61486.1 hypothetical protein SAMN04488134_109154 [Amphibacillus marinus]
MIIILTIITLCVVYLSYVRYVPVRRAVCLDECQFNQKKIQVDLRDYHQSAKSTKANKIALPIAYIKRNHQLLPKTDLYVMAANSVEKNIGIRLLRRLGHNVVGYTVEKKHCCCKKWNSKYV